MLKMNKKGIKKVGEWIIHLVLLLLVIVIFLSINSKIKDNRLHDLRVEARDFAFTRDAILSSPYSLDYKYVPRENITIILNEQGCLVQAKHKEAVTPTTFYCGIDKIIKLNQEETDKVLRITK